MKRLLILLLLAGAADADERERGTNPTSVIEDAMCIAAVDGPAFLHVDEDVSGLSIEVRGDDGQVIATYDDGAEIQDVAAPGTGAYSAPSASNVRVSPDGGDADCTEMQFADAVYNGQEWVTITVTDGQTTIMDFSRTVYLSKTLANNATRDSIMQYPLDNGISFEEAACYMLAALVGEAAFTDGSPDQWVAQDPGGNDVRVTVQYSTDPGDRSSVTVSATDCGSN